MTRPPSFFGRSASVDVVMHAFYYSSRKYKEYPEYFDLKLSMNVVFSIDDTVRLGSEPLLALAYSPDVQSVNIMVLAFSSASSVVEARTGRVVKDPVMEGSFSSDGISIPFPSSITLK